MKPPKEKCFQYTIRSMTDERVYHGFIKGVNHQDAKKNIMKKRPIYSQEDLEIFDTGKTWSEFIGSSESRVSWN